MSVEERARHAIGDLVRQLRIEQQLTQEDLAARSRMHRNFVASIERGERNPSLVTLLGLAAALDVRASDLVATVEREVADDRDA
jgi:transcriptional regulator with XRE-family HTH domain